MKVKNSIISSILLSSIFLFFSCKGAKDTGNTKNNSHVVEITEISEATDKYEIKGKPLKSSGPDAIVYKTTKDYSDLVPVIMNSERTQIVSYPAPSDIYYKGELAKPTVLKGGYLLDNRGINKNVAFTSYTYEEYSKLKNTPSIDVLLSRIVDKYPLTEMINCGIRSQYTDEVNGLNQLIDIHFLGQRKIEIN